MNMKSELVKAVNVDLDMDPAVVEVIVERVVKRCMAVCDVYYLNPAPSQRIIKHELEALIK